MSKTIICDVCGDEFPHKVECPECEGTGMDGGSNCSACRGRSFTVDPQEGNGFKLTAEFEGSPVVFNVSLNSFIPDPPDLCGRCMPAAVLRLLGEALDTGDDKT